jgi:hypothetical protein
MKRSKYMLFTLVLATLAFICVLSLGAAAQDIKHPATTQTTGPATQTIHQTNVKNAEVIHVSGNVVVVQLENGGFELLSLPKDFMFDIDGKLVNVSEVTPGTKVTQEIHTVTTPQEVTTVRTINGKVWQVGGNRLILSFPDGENKQYTVPDGIVFNIDGQKKTVFDVRKGMDISATVVTVAPQELLSSHTVMTGQAAPPNVPFEGALLIEQAAPEAAPVLTAEAKEPPAEKLPETGSLLPLTGVLGLLFMGLYAALKFTKRNAQ